MSRRPLGDPSALDELGQRCRKVVALQEAVAHQHGPERHVRRAGDRSRTVADGPVVVGGNRARGCRANTVLTLTVSASMGIGRRSRAGHDGAEEEAMYSAPAQDESQQQQSIDRPEPPPPRHDGVRLAGPELSRLAWRRHRDGRRAREGRPRTRPEPSAPRPRACRNNRSVPRQRIIYSMVRATNRPPRSVSCGARAFQTLRQVSWHVSRLQARIDVLVALVSQAALQAWRKMMGIVGADWRPRPDQGSNPELCYLQAIVRLRTDSLEASERRFATIPGSPSDVFPCHRRACRDPRQDGATRTSPGRV